MGDSYIKAKLDKDGVKSGTATRKAGKVTVQKILDAAKDALTEAEYTSFSMRTVASQAGLHLANLQYYYPRKKDLIRALFEDTNQRYIDGYTKALEGAPEDPLARLEIILNYQIDDIFDQVIRRFFVNLWALATSIETKDGQLLDKLYELDTSYLGDQISKIRSDLSTQEIKIRATLIASMIEGLMVVGGGSKTNLKEIQLLKKNCLTLALKIVTE
jgi:AcrR family transcriptional regulator